MKGFFHFSRGEFYATVTLLALITIIYSFYFFYNPIHTKTTDWSEFEATIDAFNARQQAYADSLEHARAERKNYYQHRYDYQYQNKTYAHQNTHIYNYQKDTSSLKPFPKKEHYRIEMINLNLCDTSDIVRVPKFGSKRAQKIVEYREKLGGFHSLEQLKEIYILQNIDIKFCEKYFFIDERDIKHIYINSVSYQDLLKHPYFDAYLTKSVISYRNKHGKIHNATEFQKITHAYAELMEKVTPYLCFE